MSARMSQVRYEIIGRDIASKYFVIDPDTGVLRIRDDLRKENDSEYQVFDTHAIQFRFASSNVSYIVQRSCFLFLFLFLSLSLAAA